MFELSIALKYLIPKRKSLSTALISGMSVVVISLVVWLVLVFLSVTSGIEKNWLNKLTSFHAPIRISPTQNYYHSYFYQADAISSHSNYTYKTIGEKAESLASDPFDLDTDQELPYHISKPDYLPNGDFLDPVKSAFNVLSKLQKEIPGLKFQDYEIGGALMRLSLKKSGTSLSQMSYLLSISDQNPKLKSLFIADPEKPLDFEQEPPTPPPYAYFVGNQLRLPEMGQDIPAILPKNYQEAGVGLNDTGTFTYAAITATSMQDQKVHFRVVGFYDPGIMAVGNKCILVPNQITRDIYASTQTFSPDGAPTNGIFVWIESIHQAKEIESKLKKAFSDAHISSYWNTATYENFEFSKDLLQQFRSDKTLLLIIAAIILVVACCNIISLLVLLVNDKRKEIAILQSMGASSKSIAAIFGTCGVVMGAISCLIGSLLAIFTLHHLDSLVSFLSYIQGHSAFNPAFFGKSLPNSLNFESLLFVLIATPVISLLAGLIPAIKASRIRPSTALRSE